MSRDAICPRRSLGSPYPGWISPGCQILATKSGTVLSAKITPDMDTGIGKWLEEFFQMPWLAFTGLSPGHPGAPKAGT